MLLKFYEQRIIDRVQSGEFPRYLYTYRPLYVSTNPLKLIENTTSIITKAQLWHSAPISFNDPFDCQIVLDQRHTAAIVRSMAKLLAVPQHKAPGQRKLRRQGLLNLRRNPEFIVDKAYGYIRGAMAATRLLRWAGCGAASKWPLGGATRISRCGNVRLRTALNLPAVSSLRFNPQQIAFYAQLRARQSSSKPGVIAVMRKLLLLCYSLWKK